MSISTYSDLVTELAATLGRPLSSIQTRLDNAIGLFEAEFNADEVGGQQLGVSTVTTAAGTATYAAPTDNGGISYVSYQGNVDVLRKTTLDWIKDNPTGGQGAPERWAPYPGNRIIFWPTPDGAYTMDVFYTQRLTGLTASSTTSTLLTNYPHLYLYGTLMHLLDLVQDMDRAADIRAKYSMFSNSYRRQLAPEGMAPEAGLP
jgi:hypothetical protein